MNEEKLQTFLAKGASIHKDKYDYSKVVFNTIDTRVIITCPIHGDFEQTPASHLSGKGCKLCVSTSSFEGFKEKAFKVHNKKYIKNSWIFFIIDLCTISILVIRTAL